MLSASLITLLLFLSGVMLLPASVSAAPAPNSCKKGGGLLNFPTWYEYLEVGTKEFKDKDGKLIGTDPCAIIGPADASTGKLNQQAVISRVLMAVFEILLRIAGLLAIVFIVWGGVQYQISQGEPDRLSKARSVIINALIGLAIAVSATALVNFVGRNLV